MAEEYRKETENAYLDKISDICGILPKVVTRYERSIQQMTEVRTRYAYLCDIKIFLEYISEELEKVRGDLGVAMTSLDEGST